MLLAAGIYSMSLHRQAAQFPISRAECETIQHAIIQNESRIDGRALLEKRPVSIQAGTLPQASGSAIASIESTTVLVGIHADISMSGPGSDSANGEPSTCTWSLLLDPTNPPLHDLLSKLLRVIPWEDHVRPAHVWNFHIDLLLLSDKSGGVETCSWAAIVAALRSLKLPMVSIQQHTSSTAGAAEQGIPNENGATILLQDTEATTVPFQTATMPQVTTFGLWSSSSAPLRICTDPRPEEALSCNTLFYMGHRKSDILFFQSRSNPYLMMGDAASSSWSPLLWQDMAAQLGNVREIQQ